MLECGCAGQFDDDLIWNNSFKADFDFHMRLFMEHNYYTYELSFLNSFLVVHVDGFFCLNDSGREQEISASRLCGLLS